MHDVGLPWFRKLGNYSETKPNHTIQWPLYIINNSGIKQFTRTIYDNGYIPYVSDYR